MTYLARLKDGHGQVTLELNSEDYARLRKMWDRLLKTQSGCVCPPPPKEEDYKFQAANGQTLDLRQLHSLQRARGY